MPWQRLTRFLPFHCHRAGREAVGLRRVGAPSARAYLTERNHDDALTDASGVRHPSPPRNNRHISWASEHTGRSGLVLLR